MSIKKIIQKYLNKISKDHLERRLKTESPDLSNRTVEELMDEVVDIRGTISAAVEFGFCDDLDKFHDEIERHKRGIVSRGSSAVESLLEMLKHEDPATRAFAAEMLAEIKDTRAVKPLIEVLAQMPGVIRVVSALDAIGTPETLAAVREWARGRGFSMITLIEWVNLNGANLSEAELRGADLTKEDLFMANLRNADLSKANLSGTDLRCADLTRADLSGANLRGADLRRAHLTEANLSKTNLHGANLRRADMEKTNLTRADLSDHNL